MEPYRVYIDESGDHSYKATTHPSKRFLGLMGFVVESRYYIDTVSARLEALKRAHFRFEPDDPVILTRKRIIDKKGPFGVLANPVANAAWEDAVIEFFAAGDRSKIGYFTVVMDKERHKQRYPAARWDPYGYAAAVLLNRIRGLLYFRRGKATASVIAEARGKSEDAQLQAAYVEMRTDGSGDRPAAEYRATYPEAEIRFRRKAENIPGLQIADLLAAAQKEKVIVDNQLPLARPSSMFTQRLNEAVRPFVNRYGQYLLE
ncbi:MAG: DUF3800 domain-containing protein [Chloroflexi bacterium]|nr:DUF3800 domain-containing protein [Chloroflexota bacterium]